MERQIESLFRTLFPFVSRGRDPGVPEWAVGGADVLVPCPITAASGVPGDVDLRGLPVREAVVSDVPSSAMRGICPQREDGLENLHDQLRDERIFRRGPGPTAGRSKGGSMRIV